MATPQGTETGFVRASRHQMRHDSGVSAATDNGIVLALGGGFSRGFAHLGVIEVLDQERLPISAIVGTSIGGLLGAAYADGISLSDLCDLGRKVRIRDFLRFQDSGHAHERRDCLGKFVREWFRAGSVEDLSISTVIVTTDIQSCAPYAISHGPIEPAIRASCAFPGLFKPVEFQGRQLADGCLAAPVPTEIAAQMYSGCVLGVAVAPNNSTTTAQRPSEGKLEVSFREARRGFLEPSWQRHADLLLEPEVHNIAWNDFSRVDEAFAAGAEAMRHALPRLRELLRSTANLLAGLSSSTGKQRRLSL